MGDEIQAMAQIEKAMENLEPDEARRVLGWAVSYANAKLQAAFGQAGRAGPAERLDGDDDVTQEFKQIGDLVDAASPSGRAEYALVAAYYFQELQGKDSVTGQEVNAELKDLGHGTDDITTAFDTLMKRRPPLARQVKKAGSTRQARKRYRITRAGTHRVQQMLSGRDGG